MSQLRLAYVNLKVVSRNSRSTKALSGNCARCSGKPLPSLAQKAIKLHTLRPEAANVIERLVDDVLAQIG